MLNEDLRRIYASQSVSKGGQTRPLRAHVTQQEGLFLQRCIQASGATRSLEVGCAFGISSLFILLAMRENTPSFAHTIIDPLQFEEKVWDGIGAHYIEKADFSAHSTFLVEGSETALPKLLSQGESFEFIFIDGWHTFDHCLVDVFYANKLLRPGGILCIDDCAAPPVSRVVSHVLTYPCYRFHGAVMNDGTEVALDGRDQARCIALEKVTEDERPWDWHEDF